jgi:hypothetical protein
MFHKLPYRCTAEDIIEAAKERGWQHRVMRERNVLLPANPGPPLILQKISPGESYGHGISRSYANRIGADIEGGQEWSPTDDEET